MYDIAHTTLFNSSVQSFFAHIELTKWKFRLEVRYFLLWEIDNDINVVCKSRLAVVDGCNRAGYEIAQLELLKTTYQVLK